MSGNYCGCSSDPGGSDGGGGAFVCGGENIGLSGISGNMMKKRIISPTTRLRREK